MFCKVTKTDPFHIALFHVYQWRYVCLKYTLKKLFNFGTCIPHAFFWNNLSLDMLVLNKTFPNFLKVKIQSSHILPFFSTEKKKDFKIHQPCNEWSYKMISSNPKKYITNIKQNFNCNNISLKHLLACLSI